MRIDSISGRRTALLLFVASALLAGCAPGINITRYAPSRHNLGASRTVAVIDVNGPPEATGVVHTELRDSIVRRRFFQLQQHVPQGIPLAIAPGTGQVYNIEEVRRVTPGDVYVRATVTRWDFREERIEEAPPEPEKPKHSANAVGTKNPSPLATSTYVKPQPKIFFVPEARVTVHFEVIDSASGRIVVSQPYSGDYKGDKYDPTASDRRPVPAPLLHGAAREAIDSFISEITPRTVTEKIELDDDEDALEPGIELCKRGQVDAAIRSFQSVLAKNPRSPGANYNLGVLLESRGEYAEAEKLYRKAHSLEQKSLYLDAIDDMRRRIRDEQALQRRL